MPLVDARLISRISLICGSTGAGKSEYVKRLIRSTRRLIIWDIEDEYAAGGMERITRLRDLIDAVRDQEEARVAYVAPVRRFGDWARVALAWGRCMAVAEELASVTHPGKAPEGWGDLIRRGRKRAVELIGITQRPAECDKTIVGNASIIRCGMLWRARDAAYMAEEMGVEVDRIAALKPLEWIQVDRRTRKITRGRITFSVTGSRKKT